MSTARDEAILKVDDPGFQGALARLILRWDPALDRGVARRGECAGRARLMPVISAVTRNGAKATMAI